MTTHKIKPLSVIFFFFVIAFAIFLSDWTQFQPLDHPVIMFITAATAATLLTIFDYRQNPKG